MIGAAHQAMHSWLSAHAAAFGDHVVASTLVLAALLAVSCIPTLRPRTRYALLFLGVARFLIPGSLLSALGGTVTNHTLDLPSFSMTTTFAVPAGASAGGEIVCMLASIWLAGTVIIAFQIVTSQRLSRRNVRRASQASTRESDTIGRLARTALLPRVPGVARSSAAIPMTAGLLHPVVLLPESSDQLDDDELAAVLAHELVHVERRHNLAAALQNVALAIFWFNPLLWLARSRMQNEAEKDCDEHVLDFIPDPPTYLSGMLKISYGFIAPQPAGVSCMSTSRLKERMDHLMKHHESASRSIPHLLAVGISMAVVIIATAFVSAAPASSPAPPAMSGGEQKDITPPKLVTRVDPIYPESARANRVQGIIVLTTSIDKSGNVTAVSVAQGLDGADGKALEQAATTAVKQWKFEPARSNGKAVNTNYNVTIRFKLDSKNK